jgi:hypothetical protein
MQSAVAAYFCSAEFAVLPKTIASGHHHQGGRGLASGLRLTFRPSATHDAPQEHPSPLGKQNRADST